jgi:TraY domain
MGTEGGLTGQSMIGRLMQKNANARMRDMSARSSKRRSAKADAADRRKTTSTRISSATRARLEQSAERNGRSLAQEIEYRLDLSFDSERLVAEAAGGAENAPFLQMQRLVLEAIKNQLNVKSLWGTPEAYTAMEETFLAFFEALREFAPQLGSKRGTGTGPIQGMYYARVMAMLLWPESSKLTQEQEIQFAKRAHERAAKAIEALRKTE